MISERDTATAYAIGVPVCPEYRGAVLYQHVVHNIVRFGEQDDGRILTSAVGVPKNVGSGDIITSRDLNRDGVVGKKFCDLGLSLGFAAPNESNCHEETSDASHRSNESEISYGHCRWGQSAAKVNNPSKDLLGV